MAKRQSDNAADAASDSVTSAAAQAAEETTVPSPVEIATAAVAQIETAASVLPVGHPAHVALQAALLTAQAALTAATDAAALAAQRASDIETATAAAVGLPPAVLESMLAAIETKYSPEPVVESAPVPDVQTRRAPSERTVSANAAAATDTEYAPRASAAVEAFDKDSGALACTVNRRPNTRFSGMLALAPSSAGVANYADYDRLTRAIRHHLITVKRWQASDSDGQSVPEAKWLASRGRYVLGGGVKSALACFHSGAEVAQYSDGRFRFALPNTPNVKYLRTDNAAYAAFVGGTVNAAPTAPTAAPMPPAHVPTPPQQSASASGTVQSEAVPQGTLTTTARCQHCTAKNVTSASECVQCGASDWLLD